MDKVQDIINRALEDNEFAEKLRESGLKAAKSGVSSPEWVEYMKLFGTTPEELESIRASVEEGRPNMMPKTTLTITTTTTLECTCTTTTTTTTW